MGPSDFKIDEGKNIIREMKRFLHGSWGERPKAKYTITPDKQKETLEILEKEWRIISRKVSELPVNEIISEELRKKLNDCFDEIRDLHIQVMG